MRSYRGAALALVLASLATACSPEDRGKPAAAAAPVVAPAGAPAPTAAPPAPAPAPTAPAASRPAWIVSDTPGSRACTEHPDGLDCVGVSTALPSMDQANQDAAGRALDAMAESVARDAQASHEGRPWTPNDQAAVTDRSRAAARVALDAALGIAPGVPPKPESSYREETEAAGGGSEFMVFVRMRIPADVRKALVAKLASGGSAAGGPLIELE